MTGPTRLLFNISWDGDCLTFLTTSLVDFLRDAERSGELCITEATIDALFIRILSHPPPSHLPNPPSKGDILRVMAAILASPETQTVPKIAALLGVDHSLVEGVVEMVPAKVFFSTEWRTHKLEFSVLFLKSFLHDPNRSGEFYILPTITLGDVPKLWPQYPSNAPQVHGDEIGRFYGNADESMKDLDHHSAVEGKDLAWQVEDVALPASALLKRKFPR